MKGITLYEPYASLVMLGAKKIETRSWKTNYRGFIAVHNSIKMGPSFMDLARQEPFYSALELIRVKAGDYEEA